MDRPSASAAFHVLIKPTGSQCNLDCDYCFFLSKKRLYPGSRFRMTDETLSAFLEQYLAAQPAPRATIAWQGGEPTLMGLEFFRRSIELVDEFRRPGTEISYTIQTNGTTLDDDWCDFFSEHGFLVGLSLDGPREQHDAYRHDRQGRSTFDRVLVGARLLREREVDFNVLTTVHAANAGRPLEVYRFLRDDIRARFIQLIPIVERDNDTGFVVGEQLTNRTVGAEAYGDFLVAIYDEWVRRDVGRVFVQAFDAALAAWTGNPTGLCVSSPTCGRGLALEHNGDLYSCDHYVEPRYLLGNIMGESLVGLVDSNTQRRFGEKKQDALPRQCRECRYLFACRGGCPKDRVLTAPKSAPGLNHLCQGLRRFYTHIDGHMRFMASQLKNGGAPAEIMPLLRRKDREFAAHVAKTKRNDRCPCGSGRKVKYCHGQ